MNFFKLIFDGIVTAVTLGDRLYVRITRCSCGKAGAKLGRDFDRNWYVYCSNPIGCKRRGPLAKTKRRAKKNWNEEIEQEKNG